MSKAKSIETGAHKGFTPEGHPAPRIDPNAPQKRYKVTVMYLAPLVVKAGSPEEAFEKFKLLNGLLMTDHEPEIVEATGEEALDPEPKEGPGKEPPQKKEEKPRA